MNLFTWHYSFGTNFYLHRYKSAVLGVIHYFSLPLLLPTLFAPWKRLMMSDNKHGFDFVEWLNVVSFNMVSRVVGAVVRLVLFFAGSLILIFILIFGSLGLILWTVMPFLSIGIYLKYQQNPKLVVAKIVKKIEKDKSNYAKHLFECVPGQFLANHLGVSIQDLIDNSKEILSKEQSASGRNFSDISNVLEYEILLGFFLKQNILSEKFLNKNNIKHEDMLLAANWWEKRTAEETLLSLDLPNVKVGIGKELLFGYTPILDKFGMDLTVKNDFFHHLIGRKNIVERIERTLTGGSSVVLAGEPGVGKKTVVLEFAKRAMYGELGKDLAYRRIVELDLNFLGSEATDLNQKKQNLSTILAESSFAGNIILVLRDLHRYTNSSVEGFDFTDIFEKYLEKQKLKIISISSKVDYERFIAPNIRLRKFFDTIDIIEPTLEEAMEIAVEAADHWEKKNKIIITVPALRKLVLGSAQYITDTPFPEKALEMLDAAVLYHNQNGTNNILGVSEAEQVIAERTGVPQAALGEERSKQLASLEQIIHERLVDQEEAVTLISKIIRSKSAGVVNTNRPMGSFLFLGPTGVGKTETAKVLAKVYFGSEKNIIRFDMAEYTGHEGLERLIGSQNNNQPGALTTAIKNNPASLLLLDEIEKAPPQIYNLFLALLDEGKITDAFGKTINASNLFVIATSNAGAEFIRDLVTKNKLDNLHKDVTDFVMKQNLFSPEFINRFDSVVVYKPLSEEDLSKITRILLDELIKNLKQNKNIIISFSEDAISKIAKDGYEPEFGARPMRRLIDLEIGDLIGKAILENQIASGDEIIVNAAEGKGNFKFEKAHNM